MRHLLRLGRDSRATQDVDDGWPLVENIANSNGRYGEEYDRTYRSSTHHSIESDEKLRKEVKSLNEKYLELMAKEQTGGDYRKWARRRSEPSDVRRSLAEQSIEQKETRCLRKFLKLRAAVK
ncbi:unnamed protein product [Microthlaspi erraticum]|uniref:Uncharacterized protein n=1 Tax=Microthlaspi erraticum TaxID=1685480 RepID=A0A6D2JM98_9BRAS|nr:unnamed protein product [Microthlaspi erraticum]